jgi:hypothetical protein
VPRELRSEVREFVLSAIVRPLLFVVWALVAWGTFYFAVFAYAAIVDGPGPALRRALGGSDPLAGRVNVGLAILAVVVWSVVALAVRARRRAQARARAQAAAPTNP